MCLQATQPRFIFLVFRALRFILLVFRALQFILVVFRTLGSTQRRKTNRWTADGMTNTHVQGGQQTK